MTTDSRAANGIRIDVSGLTDVGRVRKNNQDYFALVDLSSGKEVKSSDPFNHDLGPRGSLILVSDGMGGEAAGDVASRRSVETVVEEMGKFVPTDGDGGEGFAKALEAAVQMGNEVVGRESDENPAYRGMGATMTAAGVFGKHLYVVQVGDSRCYLRADGAITQLSRDQSLVGQLLAEGRITKEEAERHPHRNIILQALGKAPVIHAEVLKLPLRKGDEILLCSDGLSGLVRDEEISSKLGAASDLTSVCRELVEMANDRGGSDNITVVVARFDGESLEPGGAPRELEILKEFSFAGEEEEETQETFAPEITAFIGEAEIAAALQAVEEPPPPPPQLALPADARGPSGIDVPTYAMLLALGFGIAAGLSIGRMFGPPPYELPRGQPRTELTPLPALTKAADAALEPEGLTVVVEPVVSEPEPADAGSVPAGTEEPAPAADSASEAAVGTPDPATSEPAAADPVLDAAEPVAAEGADAPAAAPPDGAPTP